MKILLQLGGKFMLMTDDHKIPKGVFDLSSCAKQIRSLKLSWKCRSNHILESIQYVLKMLLDSYTLVHYSTYIRNMSCSPCEFPFFMHVLFCGVHLRKQTYSKSDDWMPRKCIVSLELDATAVQSIIILYLTGYNLQVVSSYINEWRYLLI